jgi:hypothetical protein
VAAERLSCRGGANQIAFRRDQQVARGATAAPLKDLFDSVALQPDNFADVTRRRARMPVNYLPATVALFQDSGGYFCPR